MNHEYRVMNRKSILEIEEKIGDGDWKPICQCASVDEAKGLLADLRSLEGSKDEN